MEPHLRSRPASPSDYETFTRLFVELATGDPIPSRPSWEAGIAPTALFHEDAGGHVVAYSFHQLLGETGYVTHVVVDPAHRGKRLGRAVMDALAALFREAGCTRWCLNVKPENTAAVRLYESVGMRRAYASRCGTDSGCIQAESSSFSTTSVTFPRAYKWSMEVTVVLLLLTPAPPPR